MNFSCVICSDQFTPSSEVYVTKCGHTFHYECLINWIERSHTCPQCRNSTTEKNIHKVYFNFVNTDHITDDVATLQAKLDHMHFQMKLKDKEVKNFSEKYSKVKAQNIRLREEVADLEEKARVTDSAIHALKEQISFFKSKSKENDRLSEEVGRLRTKLKEVENVHIAVTGTRDEVNEMLRNETNIESVILLAATLKKSLLDAEKRKRHAEHKLKQTLNEATQSKRDNNRLQTESTKLREELESLKTLWEQEKTYLRNKLAHCEKNHAQNANTSLKRIITESPVPLPKKAKVVDSDEEVQFQNTSLSVPEKVKNIVDSDSPYLPLKASSMGIGYSSLLNTKFATRPTTSKFTIFKQNPVKIENLKKPKEDSEVGYNGLGGTSRLDVFPSPKKVVTMKRSKPHAMSSVKFKKLSRITSNSKINDFLNQSS